MSGMKMPFIRQSRGRSARDKTKPDPIMTPWRAFCSENRPIFVNDNPDLDYHEIKTLLQDVWDVLDDDQKQYYEQKSKDDKWRFLEEWEAWLRQRFASIMPILPEKFPQPPLRAKNGFKVFGEAQKESFLKLMPESQVEIRL
eukprot:403374105